MRRRRVAVSCMTLCALLTLQLPWAEELGDATMPLGEIGVVHTEAQQAEPEAGVPVRIMIPAAGVDARVLPVGLMDGGKLDVPRERDDAGWYMLGPRPGQKGNAVIDGHLETASVPGVFWDLHALRLGDEIAVTDDAGTMRFFRVIERAEYDVRNAPMEKIFGATGGRMLNIITCAGTWNDAMNHYDKRLVVYAELKE